MSSIPRIYPSPRTYPPFQPIYMCDPPRIYPSQNILPFSPPFSQNIPPFSTNLYVRPSQNLPLPPRIYSPFQPIYMCDPPGIYPSLPEYTPLFNKCIYVTLPESTSPSFLTNYMRPSQNLPLPDYTPLFNKCICATLPEYTPPSQNKPPF